MTIVDIGNNAAIEGYRDPTSEEPDRLRFRTLEGERITTLAIPDDWDLTQQLTAVVTSLPRHMAEGAGPVWIETDDETLLGALLEHYNLSGGRGKRPEGWGEEEHPTVESGTVKPRKATRAGKKAAKKTTKKATAVSQTTKPSLLAIHAALLAFLATRLAVRTNSGRDWQARIMGDPASTGSGAYAPAVWIGVTEDAAAPSADSLSLPGEINTGAMVRAQAAYSHTNGQASYTLTIAMTFDEDATLRKMGVYNAVTGGTFVFETLLSSPVIGEPGDQTTLIETITL